MPPSQLATENDWENLNTGKNSAICSLGDRVLFDVVVPRKLPDKNNKKGECMARMLEDKDDVKALANAGLRVVTVRVEMQRGKMVRGLRLVKVDNDSSGTIPETEVVLLFDGPVVDMPPKEHVKDSGCTVWELGISGERATRSAKKTISKALETTTITVENAAQLVNEVLDANKNCHKLYGKRDAILAGQAVQL